MASATLSAASTIFPVGTSVKAYKRSNWPGYQQGAISGSPVGSEDATATVAADGSLTFTGLTAGTGYVAYASVGGADKYSRFEAPNAQGTADNPEQVSSPSGAPLVVDSGASTATDLGVGGGAVAAGAVKLWGFTARETAGAVAIIRLRDGVVGGKILATVSLAASESVREVWPKPLPVANAAGVYVQLVSGTIPEGTVFTS